MPHIGASTWVYPEKNGELIQDIDECTDIFFTMLEKYDRGQYFQHCKNVAEEIKPDRIFPEIVDQIKKLHNKKFKHNENIF